MNPNILFIFMDNLGYGEVGCYGGGILRGAPTPNIDALAREGTKLLNFNAPPRSHGMLATHHPPTSQALRPLAWVHGPGGQDDKSIIS